jgi:hypothetical protein
VSNYEKKPDELGDAPKKKKRLAALRMERYGGRLHRARNPLDI